MTFVFIVGVVFFGMYLGHIGMFNRAKKESVPNAPRPVPSTPVMLSKADVKTLLRDIRFLNATQKKFIVNTDTGPATVQTHLDTRLQAMLNKRLARLKGLTRGKPQRIAAIAMDGQTGFIKAMVGFDLSDPQVNPCLVSDYPAASIIKIVTAAAAVDALDYTANTPLSFNGGKYTLYKRQLIDKNNKYTTKVTLATAFAESINPVFGKIGKLYLGRERLNLYASRFGFNTEADTDFYFQGGRFTVTDNAYHLAELGCGFNRKTQISPMFATLLTSVVVNEGQSLIPRMVDHITKPDGQIVYKSKKDVYKIPIRPNSAKTMITLMKRTISNGTARKVFRGYSRDKVLSKLIIGGKTGSLFNRQRTVKYDWFTGFGMAKDTGNALIVAVVVGHRKYIGTKAAAHARAMLKTYFKPASNHPT